MMQDKEAGPEMLPPNRGNPFGVIPDRLFGAQVFADGTVTGNGVYRTVVLQRNGCQAVSAKIGVLAAG